MKLRALQPCLIAVLGTAAASTLVLNFRNRELPPLPGARAAQASPVALAVRPATLPPDDPKTSLDLEESVVLAQRKRLMGRERSLEMIERVATHIGPLVAPALEQRAIQRDLQALAAGAGMSLADYKQYFQHKQEADLLLESGGDPNAKSPSNAIGVAQFLAGTGRGCGLYVNEVAARPITRQMAAVQARIDWLKEQPADWGKPAPVGKGFWDRDRWIEHDQYEWKRLEAKRRKVDQRYDPGKAIEVQTRYLVRLSRRYGSLAWALQAYHGGEGGVARTVSLYRYGFPSLSLPEGQLPRYEELYQEATPSGRTDAFYYLYGRSDDHRYYWWKVLMAERAIRLYREDPKEFHRQREELRPGYRMEVAWYGNPDEIAFEDVSDLRAAEKDGELVGIPGDLNRRGIRLGNIQPFDAERRADYKRLRPEAMGALLKIASVYRSHGGRTPLEVISLVQTTGTAREWRLVHPPAPIVHVDGTKEEDPDFHPTGYVFDLARPASDWDRRVLEYSLGTLYDRLRISWLKEEEGRRRYHVVPNPTYKEELARAAG